MKNLVGVAQTKFMRSLHEYSLMPKSLIMTEKNSSFHFDFRIFYIFRGTDETSIDLIPLTANSGMLRYGCEILGFSTAQRFSPVRLLDFRQHVNTENALVTALQVCHASQLESMA